MLITCGLLVFSYLNLTLTGLSTAQGDSKTPLMANLLGLISNMILDPYADPRDRTVSPS